MVDGERKGMGYRSIYLDLDVRKAAQRREQDDGAGSASSWFRIWDAVRANAPKGLLRWLIRQAEDEERPAWEIVLRALKRERAACQTPAIAEPEPEPGDDDAPAEDGGGEGQNDTPLT
jgi:hypothetical protein